MRVRVQVVAGLFTLLASLSDARSQVNVEPIRSKLGVEGNTVQVRASVAGTRGNTDGVTAGAGALFGVRGDEKLFYFTASGDYARYNSETSVQKAFAHARYNHQLWRGIWGELFAQLETDRFRRVNLRELLGVGPRFAIVESDAVSIHFGTSYMLELTQRSDVVTTDRSVLHHRWNNYGTITYRAHPSITLSETFYFQPRFDDFADHWLLSVLAARFEVTDRLASHIDLSLRRESRVPRPVERNDLAIASGLSLSF